LVILTIGVTAAAVAGQKLSRNELRTAEQRLANLGYWLTKPDGVVDASTRHAVTAFQKVEGRKRTGTLSRADYRALTTAVAPQPQRRAGERHIEVDLTRQVLFLFGSDGAPEKIVPVSSGNEERYFQEGKWQVAHTVRGEFRVVRKINGVRKAPLGSLYYPMYFYEGWAIHGSNSVPARPASHGCIRVPRGADIMLFRTVPTGTPVIVYD
jgi:lipoprotein-anchoring transpeptidase ErfK/SrfK